MRTIQEILLVSSLSLLLPFAALAQSISDVQALSSEDRREYMESMSDDERNAMREKWRAEYEQLPEDQKMAIREQRAANRGGKNRGRDREAMKQRWDSMSEEERAAAKERRRAQSDKRREQWESMSEEERAAMREQRGGHNGQRQSGQHKDHAGRGDANPSAEPES
jgi:colicin import membrane protein